MDRIYEITTPNGIVYMVKEEYGTYKLTDKYKDNGELVITDCMSKDEFFIEEMIEREFHRALSEIVNTAIFMLPDGIKGIDLSFIEIWGRRVITLIIKWGDIEITNSYDQIHPLLGMYTECKFEYSLGKMKMTNFRIFRDRYTNFEWLSKYRHSHTPRHESRTYFSTVCMGDANLRTTFMRRIVIKKFDATRLFMYIEAFIAWESLEGGPFYTLTDLYERISVSSGINSIDPDVLTEMVENMQMEILLTEYQVTIPSNIISEAVLNTSGFKKTLPKRSVVKKEEWWKSYEQEIEPIESRIEFNGEKVMINIIPNTEEDDRYMDTVFCYPNNHITTVISDKFSNILSDRQLMPLVEERKEQEVELTF